MEIRNESLFPAVYVARRRDCRGGDDANAEDFGDDMPKIKSLFVGDTGDSSVGIIANNWKILFESDLELDDDQVEPFRAEVKALFDGWNENGFPGRVEFDFETEKRLAGELALDKMLDEASDTGDEMKAQQKVFDEIFGY